MAPKRFENYNGQSACSAYNGASMGFVMADTESTSAAEPPVAPGRSAGKVIIASATEAFGSALVVWFLGGVAISIAASFAGDMIPSLPPVLARLQSLEDDPAKHHAAWRQEARGAALVFCFAIFFAHSLWLGFHGRETAGGGRIGRILSKVREDWFGLIVGNAIKAWAAVLVLGIAGNFSPVKIVWECVAGTVLPTAREIGTSVLGASNWASLGVWFSWYEANQMKLNFWILYLAGAFDDLGVPNFKTLARWGWRRMQKRATPPLTASLR
jgi:hypothetical protein